VCACPLRASPAVSPAMKTFATLTSTMAGIKLAAQLTDNFDEWPLTVQTPYKCSDVPILNYQLPEHVYKSFICY
jgi:hypothetical protein